MAFPGNMVIAEMLLNLCSLAKKSGHAGIFGGGQGGHRSHIAGSIVGFGVFLLMATAFLACSRPVAAPSSPALPPVAKAVSRMGYSIQVGAFAVPENATRLAEALSRQGLESTCFHGSDGLYRVRFGNFGTREEAMERAKALEEAGVIDVFHVVNPPEPSQSLSGSELVSLRQQLVEMAMAQLGTPYLWGGSTKEGFDCSGLVMAVYRLNGYVLPRNSREQFRAGEPVEKTLLQAGDLVFFATRRPGQVSHVGIYIGEGEFIHAPSRGKRVRKESLSGRYFSERFMGARRYFG